MTGDACPCGSGRRYPECCEPVVEAAVPAPTAEALMRSRYTAFVLDRRDHIARTWAPETRDPGVSDGDDAAAVEWLGLDIVGTAGGGPADTTGTVEFAARYRSGGRTGVHREVSRFRRDGGDWVYIDGDVAPEIPAPAGKVGRNDPCPCGSGRKFKKCCGA